MRNLLACRSPTFCPSGLQEAYSVTCGSSSPPRSKQRESAGSASGGNYQICVLSLGLAVLPGPPLWGAGLGRWLSLLFSNLFDASGTRQDVLTCRPSACCLTRPTLDAAGCVLGGSVQPRGVMTLGRGPRSPGTRRHRSPSPLCQRAPQRPSRTRALGPQGRGGGLSLAGGEQGFCPKKGAQTLSGFVKRLRMRTCPPR